MKKFIITPAFKKSVLELSIWQKEDSYGTYSVRHELWWRTGRFSISVPETNEEKAIWAEAHGYDIEDLDSVQFLPNEDDDEVELDDYEAELLDCDDSTYSDYSLTAYPEDANNETIEAIKEGIEEEGDEYLEDNGWSPTSSFFVITKGVVVSPAE